MNCIIPKSLKKLVSEARSSSHINANRSRLSFVGKPYLNSLRASNMNQRKPGIYRSRTSSCVCVSQGPEEVICKPNSTNRKNQRSSSEKTLKPILKKQEEKYLLKERKVRLAVIFPHLCEKEIQEQPAKINESIEVYNIPMENIKYELKRCEKNIFNDANSNKAFTTKKKKKKITEKPEIRKIKTINTVDDSRAYRAALENEEISYLIKPMCIERHLQDKTRFQFY